MHQDRYKIDRTYQRDEDVWEKWMESYLIDTILRGYSIPLIYIHKKKAKQYIVDGQQRINTIKKFYKNKIELQMRDSKDIIKANGNATTYKDLSDEYKDNFDRYPLHIAYLENYSDEEIRSMFKRLQTGKPLNPGEKLNSYPGLLIPALRSLRNHRFFTNVTTYSGSRHKHLFLASQLLFLEHSGINDLNTTALFQFAENNENMTSSNQSIIKMKQNLNLLCSIFKEKTGQIEKPGWIVSLYLFTSYLNKNYSIKLLKREIKDFYIDFYHRIESAPTSKNITLNRFSRAISKSTTSKTNIQMRHDIMLEKFLKEYRPSKLDENRLFTKNQKMLIFRRDSERCTVCKKKLKFNSPQANYHHAEMYVEGGETEISNGVLVCKDCHSNTLHKNR